MRVRTAVLICIEESFYCIKIYIIALYFERIDFLSIFYSAIRIFENLTRNDTRYLLFDKSVYLNYDISIKINVSIPVLQLYDIHTLTDS